MNSLSTEVLLEIGKLLPRHALSQLCRVNRRCCADLQQQLFRLHGHPDDWNGPSAIFWAVEIADLDDPVSQALSMAVLRNVEAFCSLEPGALDRSFNRNLSRYYNSPVTRPGDTRYSCLGAGDPSSGWSNSFATKHSFNPLHLAAHKGLHSIAAWLLAHGADVNALIDGTTHNALVAAVLANHASTALLLLSHGADQAVDMRYNGLPFSPADDTADSNAARRPVPPRQYRPLITTLAVALSHEKLAEKLMDSGLVPEANLTEMLYVSGNRSRGPAAFAASLVRRGAEVSPRMLQHLTRDQAKYWDSLPLAVLEAMPLDNPLFAETATPNFAEKAIIKIRSDFKRSTYFADFHGNHYDINYYESDIPLVQRALRRLLMLDGVDPNHLGRSLWLQSSHKPFDYAWIKILLPPFLEAGMDVRRPVPAIKDTARRRLYYGTEHGPDAPDDLLAAITRYESLQCAKGAAMQLGVVRLLLQYGAPVTAAVREDALRDYPVGPSMYSSVGRAGWSVTLCNAILEHCCSVPKEKQTDDMREFLALYEEKTKRVSTANTATVNRRETR